MPLPPGAWPLRALSVRVLCGCPYSRNRRAAFFLSRLDDATRGYLHGRGLTDETVQKWGLGRAPDGWNGLLRELTGKGVPSQTLLELGLVKEKDGRCYDTFRNRVTIPIHDVYGRPLGFTGRTLGDDPAKYLNTPETSLFRKGELLFGLPQARETLREKRAAIVVEGHLDVIALHQGGYPAAVGAQSATLTEAQIAALEQLGVEQLYLAFDADEARVRATLAGCESVARRMVIKVVKLPLKDPAEVLQRDPVLFRRALIEAESEPVFRVKEALRGLDLNTRDGERQALERLRPAMIDRVILDPVAQEVRRAAAQHLTTR